MDLFSSIVPNALLYGQRIISFAGSYLSLIHIQMCIRDSPWTLRIQLLNQKYPNLHLQSGRYGTGRVVVWQVQRFQGWYSFVDSFLDLWCGARFNSFPVSPSIRVTWTLRSSCPTFPLLIQCNLSITYSTFEVFRVGSVSYTTLCCLYDLSS